MERGERLSAAELLEIAQDVKNGGDMPEGLTRDEKEDVREFLDILYASDKAVKAYWIKMAYLDKVKEAAAKEAQLQTASAYALRAQMQASDYYRKLNLIETNYKKTRASLDREALSNIRDINKQVDGEWKLLVDRLLRIDKRINDQSKFRFQAVKREISSYVQTSSLNDFLLNSKNTEVAERVSRNLKAMEEKLQSYNKADSYLAMAIQDYMQKVTDLSQAAYREYGMPIDDAYKGLRQRARHAQSASAAAEAEYERRFGEYAKAKAEAEVERRRTNLAGKWYIVAACGEMLTELGQSLMNG